ncbi:ORF V: Enzymatic polyprotein [Labeo rohita]|uniref:ORF V: Enzymatic polyprotein n=1 Tax=Labeo rohita TaxID=84645 RepID=A0ABQ8MP52_LABRO|nr:ORF V: Enzymatic polyprotein [Labeo rohita]
MAAVSNVIPFGLLFMRPLQWCLKTKGVLPERKPALHDQGHAAMPTCLGHVEETLVLVSGPGAGSSLSPCMLVTDASLTGWGVVMSGHPACGLWSGPLRAGPTGEGCGPPHSSVPVSPLCPRETSLPTLPVLQGAAVSSEPTPQSSARKRSGAGELATPAGVSTAASSAVSCRSSVTGHRTSSSNNTRGQSRETGSLSRLFGSVETTAKCICLGPAHCRARLSHSIWRSTATFQWGLHCGEPRAGLVMEQEVETLLRKEAIEVVPPHDRESGFYSRYFIVPKKDGGLRPLLDLRLLNRSVEVPEVCFHGRSLPVTGSSVQPCALPPHLKELGLRFNAKKSVLSRHGVGFDHDAGTFVTCSDRVDPHCSHESERRPVTHCKAVPATAGSDGSCVQRDTFWPAVHETPTVVAQDQGVLPEGKPVLHDQGHAAMPTCLRHVEEALVPVSGPGATDASLTGWGAVMSGHPARGLWSSRYLTWHINCLEMLAMFRALKHFLPDLIGHHVLVRTDNTVVDKLLSLRAVHVPGHLNMGADILSRQGLRPREWMLHPEVVKQVWRVFGQAQVDLFATKENAQCHHWCSLTYPAPLGLGCHGTDVAEASSVRFSPDRSAPGSSGESAPEFWKLAPSSRKLYALKWKPFTSWCGDRQQDSVNCPVGTVLGLLQNRLSTGLAHSTLKVYVAAISAYHAPLGGSSVGRNPLVTRFLRGALRARPLARCSFAKCSRDAIS